MSLEKELVIAIAFCISMCASSASTAAPQGIAENSDSMSKQVDKIFAQAGEFTARRKQHARKYLNSLPDNELAEVWARANIPQKMPPSGMSGLSKSGLEKVKKDRQMVIEQLLKRSSPLDEREHKSFESRADKLAEELATLGSEAVPAVALRMGDDYRMKGHWAMAKKALLKMGPAVVERLIPLMDSADSHLRSNVAQILSRLGDTQAKGVFLRHVDDESGHVRAYALRGLVEWGPDAVGNDELVTILVEHVEDHYDEAVRTAIDGLSKYGDETVIEALSVVERFHQGTSKDGVRDIAYRAREAINAILRRAGKPAEEVSREHYAGGFPYSDIVKATQCQNAAIRRSAATGLSRYRDDKTALLLIERIKREQDPVVLDEIARTLHSLMIPPKGSIEPTTSVSVVQKAFDNWILLAETALPQNPQIETVAIQGVRSTVYVASLRVVSLRNIDRAKRVVRRGLSSNVPDVKIACYPAVTSIANISAEMTGNWSPQERDELQQQLAPLLDSPAPNIRLIQCLGYVGNRRLAPGLIELLGHNDSTVRRFAAYALSRIGDPRALPALKHVAETDPHQYENGVYGVREAARIAIERIAQKEPVRSKNEITINRKVN